MPRQHLTPNACLVCRKKRTKCDGKTPCRRCRSRGEECSYEDKKWRTKDHLRSEIERLRSEQRQGLAIIRTLTNNDPKKWEAVLTRLRDDESPESVAQWINLREGLSDPAKPMSQDIDSPADIDDASPPLLRSPFRPKTYQNSDAQNNTCSPVFSTPNYQRTDIRPNFSDGSGSSQSAGSIDGLTGNSTSTETSPAGPSRFKGLNRLPRSHSAFALSPLGQDATQFRKFRGKRIFTPPSIIRPIQAWTSVTNDTQLVQRLMGRFFLGETLSVLPLVSPPQLARGFSEGIYKYCSESLVNAILGWACELFDPPLRLVSRVSFGDAFLGESKRLLSQELTHVNLPSIQALAIIAMVEICQGGDEEAWRLSQEIVRLSIQLALQGKQQAAHPDESEAAQALAYCGGFTLMRVLRLLTGRLEPNTGPLFMRLQPDARDSGEDAPEVRVERGISLQMRFFAELRFCPPLDRFVFEVTEAVHTFSSYNFSKAMTAEDLEDTYNKCIGYQFRFSKAFSHEMGSTPDFLFAEIWYHFCLLCLLRPFVNSTASLIGNTGPRLRDGATPRSVCRESSETVIFLTSKYQTRFSLSHPSPLLPHMLFSAVLHQLTLVVDHRHVQEQPVEAVIKASPSTRYGSPQHHDPGSPIRPIPFTPSCSSRAVPQPLSPTLSMQARRAARRRASGLSIVSTCDSAGSSRVPGLSPRAPDEPWSEADDVLPNFTSEPEDLVTVGSLQLVSMGAQHSGAADAARLLHSLGPVKDLVGSNVDLSLMARFLPSQGVGFGLSRLLTGLGLQAVTPIAGVLNAAGTNPTPSDQGFVAPAFMKMQPVVCPGGVEQMQVST